MHWKTCSTVNMCSGMYCSYKVAVCQAAVVELVSTCGYVGFFCSQVKISGWLWLDSHEQESTCLQWIQCFSGKRWPVKQSSTTIYPRQNCTCSLESLMFRLLYYLFYSGILLLYSIPMQVLLLCSSSIHWCPSLPTLHPCCTSSIMLKCFWLAIPILCSA